MSCSSLARSPSTQLGVNCEFSETAHRPIIQVIKKDIKESCPKYQSLKTISSDHQLDARCTIHCNPLRPVVRQFSIHLIAYCPPRQTLSHQFGYQGIMGNHTKGFAKVKIYNIH